LTKTDGQSKTNRGGHTGIEKEREAKRRREKETDTQSERKKDIQTDRQTEQHARSGHAKLLCGTAGTKQHSSKLLPAKLKNFREEKREKKRIKFQSNIKLNCKI
jgi:hypothetical protein